MGATYGGTVEVSNQVEISNDLGNPIPVSGLVDLSDRIARVLGHVAVDSLPSVDISDRIDRILGQVSVVNFPTTQPVSGTVNVGNFPNSQAVTGPLTDTQLRATPVPVDTELSAAGPLSTEATLSAINTKLAGTLTVDTELSAAGPLSTEATLAAVNTKLGNPLAVTQSGTWTVTQSGTVAVDSELPTAAALSDTLSRNQSVPVVGAATLVDDGTQLTRLRGYAAINGTANTAGLLPVTPVIWTGGAFNGLQGATGDNGVSALFQTNVPYLINSAGQVDRQRANVEGTALASAARTATLNGPDTTNYNGRGVLVYLNVTAASGTGGLLLRIQGKDPVSGGYFSLTVAPTAVTATGLYVYELYPGATGGNATQTTGTVLPRIWRVSITHNDASSYTYSVGYSIML